MFDVGDRVQYHNVGKIMSYGPHYEAARGTVVEAAPKDDTYMVRFDYNHQTLLCFGEELIGLGGV